MRIMPVSYFSQTPDETHVTSSFLVPLFYIMTDNCHLCFLLPSLHWPDSSKGPGGLSPATWFPVYYLHSGYHQKCPSQTHHSAWTAVSQQRNYCQSAANRWSSGRQLTSVPERNPAYGPTLWCGGVLSLTGHCSRGVPGRKKNYNAVRQY